MIDVARLQERMDRIRDDERLLPQRRLQLLHRERALALVGEVRDMGVVEHQGRRLSITKAEVTDTGALLITGLEVTTVDGEPLDINMPILVINPPVHVQGQPGLDIEDVKGLSGVHADARSSVVGIAHAILGAAWEP